MVGGSGATAGGCCCWALWQGERCRLARKRGRCKFACLERLPEQDHREVSVKVWRRVVGAPSVQGGCGLVVTFARLLTNRGEHSATGTLVFHFAISSYGACWACWPIWQRAQCNRNSGFHFATSACGGESGKQQQALGVSADLAESAGQQDILMCNAFATYSISSGLEGPAKRYSMW